MGRHYSAIVSRLFGRFAGTRFSPVIQRTINRAYVRLMRLDMAAFESPESYPTLNALFTRSLIVNRRFDTREEAIISPCDARVSEAGYVHEGQAHQIKGMRYDTAALLGAEYAADLPRLEGGAYVNLYLSPRDYHRYHMPMELWIDSITHVPGKLYPVNMPLLRNKVNLFIENERVIIAATDGSGARHFLVLVGALNVGKMVVTFEESINTNSEIREPQHYTYENLTLEKGELFGWFEMGSTILLFSQKDVFTPTLAINQKVKFAQNIGTLN